MEQSRWDASNIASPSFNTQISPCVPNNPTVPLRNQFDADEIYVRYPLEYQQALQSLQQYPKSFIHAWLLVAKALGLSAQTVRNLYQPGSALAIEQLQTIAILKDLPHDHVLAWYGGDATAGHDTGGAYHCSHDSSSTCRSSTCSTIWTKASSSRPSSRSSYGSIRPSLATQDKEKRASRRPPSSCLGDLIETTEPDTLPQDQLVADQRVANGSCPDGGDRATLQQTEKSCIYKCTGCTRVFKSMQTWARHEREDHEDISFPCMPNGAIELSGSGRACALCGQEPTAEHLRSHTIERCTQLKQVFKRSDHLKQHLESHGLAKKSRQSELLVTKWQRVPDKRAWACGFCKAVSSSLMDFHKHVATQHYERGEDRKWDHTKVILGLLSQSHIAGPWERLLAKSFKVKSLSCKWSKTKSGCLQTRLQLGQESGEVLAEAALDCAIYDRDLLHEAFRPQESSGSDSSKRSSPTTSGPPVPPKPSFFQQPSRTEDVFDSNAEQRCFDLMTLSSFDQFKVPSPPLLDLSPRAWEFYMSQLDQTDRAYQYDWNSYVDPGAIQPMDIDAGSKFGFPS